MFDLDPNEKIILKLRRHKLTLVFETMFLAVFIVLPPMAYYFYHISGLQVQVEGNSWALALFVYSAILLLAWVIFFKIWTDYYLDILIITDKRIIDVEQKGFFHREISTVRLDNIEDITVSINGIVATFLDFGNLRIQSAAESREFLIRNLPQPNKVKSIIYDLHNKMLDAPKEVRIMKHET